MFFSGRRYDLGKVGRYKLNKKFDYTVPVKETHPSAQRRHRRQDDKYLNYGASISTISTTSETAGYGRSAS